MKALFVGGTLNGLTIKVEDISNYIEIIDYTEDLTAQRSNGALVHRKELDNQPKVKGYLGPMWDGDKIRYETQEVYNALSC